MVASTCVAAQQVSAAPSPVPQIEVTINRAFDGSAAFSKEDPLNDDKGGHTPGLDLNATNWVVRTHDGFGVRVDWDVNEQPAKNVTLVVTLKNGVSTPATEGRVTLPPENVVAGCDPTKSAISGDGLSYTCFVGDVDEGTHGTIFPVFALGDGVDGTQMDVSVTMTADSATPAASGSVPFIVSEAPSGDWIKQTTAIQEITGGYVVMFPLSMRDNNQAQSAVPTKGAGLIRYSTFDLYDHGYKLPTDTALASDDQVKEAGFGGDRCGNYSADNGKLGALGKFPVNDNVTITCTEVAGAPYPLTKLTITPKAGFVDQPIVAPAQLASEEDNFTGLVFTAQIAFFVPSGSAVDKVQFQNALSALEPAIDPDKPVITPADVNAAGDKESGTTNNTGQFGFGSGTGGTAGWAGSTHLNHYGVFSKPVVWAPYNSGLPDGVLAYNPMWVPFWPPDKELSDPSVDNPYSYAATGQYFKPFQSVIDPPSFWDGNGLVTRNTPLTMNLVLTTSNTQTIAPTTPIQGCMTWSLDQVNLNPMDDIKLDLSNRGVAAPIDYKGEILVGDRVSNRNFTGDLPTEDLKTNRFDYLIAGQAPPDGYSRSFGVGSLGPTLGSLAFTAQNGLPATLNFPTLVPFPDSVYENNKLQIIVEYAQDPDLGPDAEMNEVDCNNTNPDTGKARKWIDLNTISDADLKTYEDPDQLGTYRFNMVRVRTVGEFPWSTPWNPKEGFGASGIVLSVSGVTGNDLPDVNKDGTEMYLHTSRSLGAWDPATQDAPSTNSCASWVEFNPPMLDKAIEDEIKTRPGGVTDWCNMRYLTSLDQPANEAFMTLDPNSFSWAKAGSVQSTTNVQLTGDSDSDRITITGVRPAVTKSNAGGLFAIAGNGDQVTFNFTVSAIGAPIEALSDYVFTDVLDPRYRFVKMDDAFPNTPGATCTTPPEGETGTITCQLSEPDPKVDTGDLLPGLPGGWSDTLSITVEVRGAVSSVSGNRAIANTATAESPGYGQWDALNAKWAEPIVINPFVQTATGTANSYLPTAFQEGDIVKSIAEGSDPCRFTPPTAPATPAWATRCAMTTLDVDSSNQPTPDTTGNLNFTLDYTNFGSTKLNNLKIIDVLPFSGDGTEPPSNSATPVPPGTIGANPSTLGDGRTPNSDFKGTVGFKSAELSYAGAVPSIASDPTAVTYLFTGDAPATISRDPAKSELENTWCKSDGTVVFGTGSCPTDYTYGVTAVMAVAATIAPNETATLKVALDTEDNSCSSLYTNTFGARADEIWLPIRSNDISFMVDCTFDLALQKRVGADWKPGADWVTYGTSTVTFDIEVVNQGAPVEDFDVTDYIDTNVFTYVAADNPAGTTKAGTLGSAGTGPALAYTWSGADGADKPVAKIEGKLATGESVILPITVRVKALTGKLINHSEISRFDDDGDASNGDSDPANPNNPTSGPLRDIDSTPDSIFGNDVEIDNEINLTPATGDEDDEDVAEVPWYDLALVKDLANGQPQTLVFDGDTALVNYVILVKNQGLYPAKSVAIIDTPPAGFSYDASNPTGVQTLDGASVTYEGDGKFLIAELTPGQQVTIPVTYQVNAADALAGDWTNVAEIYQFTDAAGNSQPDVDSIPDTIPRNDAYTDPEGGREGDGGESPDFDVLGDGDLHNRAAAAVDEDDNDREVVKFSYSLGNQVWIDANNNGVVDSGEAPVKGAVMLLFQDSNGDGLADDTNGDGQVSESDSLASTTTDDAGLYLFSNLQAGGYIVGVASSNFAGGAVLELYRSSDPTSVNPDDNIDQDDNGIPNSGLGNVMTGTVTLGGVEPLNEPGPDNDPNADSLSNLTVDFGFYIPDFDLALRKTLATSGTVTIGQLVTFDVTVFNQGKVPASNIRLVDYPPPSLELVDNNWTIGDLGYPYLNVGGTLQPGESTTVKITFRTTQNTIAVNHSEIFSATPLAPDGSTLTYQNGQTVPDKDSFPDNVFGNDVEIDDEINLTPATGDEDDEDIARIEVIADTLPESGSNPRTALMLGATLLAVGLTAYAASRRRRLLISQ